MKTFPPTKPHYLALDGLRGVAALLVVTFHLFEAHANSKMDQLINHGYLAVDFFFMLSGFVIAYAYDDRWNQMRIKDFLKRRVIRLHPMVIMGTIIGLLTLLFQPSEAFPLLDLSETWKIAFVALVGFTLLPVPPSMDIRGWNEMHPLNGPAWSLFFEYIANILYALFIHRFSTKILAICTLVAGGFLFQLAISKGDMIGGWAFTMSGLQIGFTRLAFPFLCGLLLSRIGKPIILKNAFLFCSLAMIFCLAFPRVGGDEGIWMNGLYESVIILFVFPVIVLVGAGARIKHQFSLRLCRFLGDISYPLYITHYPLVYLYYAYVRNNNYTASDALPIAFTILLVAVVLAYLYLKLYDEPVRRWLSTTLGHSKSGKKKV